MLTKFLEILFLVLFVVYFVFFGLKMLQELAKPADRPVCPSTANHVSKQSLASTYNKLPKKINKISAFSHYCLLIQPVPSLWHWYTGYTWFYYDPCPNNLITFLDLCFPGDCRQRIESSICVPIFSFTKLGSHVMFTSS